ncbi:MAG: PEP/pyruvate-binding domain-containing protein, partial [Myxococcota bacterium]
ALRSEDTLFSAVRAVWASLYGIGTFGYRKTPGISPTMGVLLQQMVPADTAGVMFTANPMTGDGGEVVINASYGLGATVVEGRVAPDTVRVDKRTRTPRERILGEKAIRLDLTGEGAVESTTSEADRARFCLTDAQVNTLADAALRIEEAFGAPQDIEWAFEGEQLWILQARPITTEIQPATRRWRKRDGRDRGELVWSNINVGEALPGVATPLTWSVLSGYSERGFRQAFQSLGCSVPAEAELVGAFRGRIYLNLTEFLAILSAVPGLDLDAMLRLGGGEPFAGAGPTEPIGRRRYLARLPLTVSRFAADALTFEQRLEEFEDSFRGERQRVRHLDLRILSNVSLSRTLNDAARLLDESGSLMLSAYGNLLACLVALRGGLRVFGAEDAMGLLTGLNDLESAAPGVALWHIAAIARDEPAARTALEQGAMATDALGDGPTGRALHNFLEAYGHRGPREGELYEPRWRDDPSIVLAALRLQVQHPGSSPAARERAARDRWDRAWARLGLRGPSAFAMRRLLTLTKRQMRFRERLRDHVTEVLGFYRRIAVDASRRMRREPHAGGDDAAFFLTESELHSYLGGRRSVVAAVPARRRRFERDRALPDPPSTFTGYPPDVLPPVHAQGLLKGLGTSGGTVRGVARVITSGRDAAALQPGEVLVAPAADIGLSPLFMSAAAVVTELGGPLSHAAIVLREYAVPAVFNVAGATRQIKDGDVLEVDGERGLVHVLENS